MRIQAFALAFAAALAASPVPAATIEPAQPIAFEPVNLRMTVDGCAFVPQTVRVRAIANVLQVTQQMNSCFAPGPVEIADVRLGSLAPGDYRVELYASPQASGTPLETLTFTVSTRPEIAVFPPPPRPITDYSGMWWNAGESGWGLSLHQSATDVMFAALFVYGADGEAEWFTFQGGRWETSTRWSGVVYRTTGPFYGGLYDPRLVQAQPVGVATLDFLQVPGDVLGSGRVSYSIDSRAIAKTITRMPM